MVDVSTPSVHVLVGVKPVTLPKFDPVSVESSGGSRLSAWEKVRIARLQMEKEDWKREFQFCRELQLKKLADDAQLRQEMELRKLEADTAVRMLELKAKASPVLVGDSLSSTSAFNVGRNILLVPVFCELEVESYFGTFERITGALSLPWEIWALLLQCKLCGKAQEACAFFSAVDSLCYEKLKETVLRA